MLNEINEIRNNTNGIKEIKSYFFQTQVKKRLAKRISSIK